MLEQLEPGTRTDLKVRNDAIFDGRIDVNNVNVTGILTAVSYKLDSTSVRFVLVLLLPITL